MRRWCEATGVPFAVSDVFEKGGAGRVALAEAVAAHAEQGAKPFTPLYDWSEPIPAKMDKVARAMYGAREVEWSREARRALTQIEALGFGGLPLCIAKTQKSLSDDPQVVGRPADFEITVRDVILAAGAGYVVPLLGDIMRMPGLPATPQAERMDRWLHDPESLRAPGFAIATNLYYVGNKQFSSHLLVGTKEFVVLAVARGIMLRFLTSSCKYSWIILSLD